MTLYYPYERVVQLGVLAYSADNLEAHLLGNERDIIDVY